MIPSDVSANTMETFIRKFNETIMTMFMEKRCAMITLSGVEFNSKDSLILHHFVVTDILKHILKFRNNFLDEPIDKLTDEDLKLDDHEENTIRYVAGYIPFSLLKSQEDRPEGKTKDALVAVLHSWNDEQGGRKMTFLEYTRAWTEKINRGGLFIVNDDYYIFIRRVGNVCRMYVCRKNLNQTLMIR